MNLDAILSTTHPMPQRMRWPVRAALTRRDRTPFVTQRAPKHLVMLWVNLPIMEGAVRRSASTTRS